jgi:lipoprotein-anchoring transpeptidase ErfK/SrfK
VICTGEIERASGLSPGEMLHPGEKLRVPTEPASVLVDLDSRWMFYLFGSEVACAWEVAIGAPDSETTPGIYHAGEKQENPTWFPEGQPPVPFGDPQNPLGTRWIGWIPADGAGGRGLGFHGTREPETIGAAVSDGCIRLRNEEVEELFRILPRGARITVRP